MCVYWAVYSLITPSIHRCADHLPLWVSASGHFGRYTHFFPLWRYLHVATHHSSATHYVRTYPTMTLTTPSGRQPAATLYRELPRAEAPRDHFLWSLVLLLYVVVLNLYVPGGDGVPGASGCDCGGQAPTNGTAAEALEVRLAAVETELLTLQTERGRKDDGGLKDDVASAATGRAEELEQAERRRAQAGQACARGQDFQVLTDAAMDACCPASAGGGHRRSLQASCDLPATCPSAACAAVFVPFMADCDAMLASMPGVPLNDFQSFESSCQELTAGAQMMLQPVAVQMFRVLIDTEGAAQSGSMFPGSGTATGGGGGNGQPLDPLQPLFPSSATARCDSRLRRRNDRRHAVPRRLHLGGRRELRAGVQRGAPRLRAAGDDRRHGHEVQLQPGARAVQLDGRGVGGRLPWL